MFIDEQGSGPAVLLLHGCPTATTYFEPLIRALAPTRRVLTPQLPGYGKSPSLPGAYSLSAVQQQLEETLLTRGVTDVAVVGYSLGAWRALSLALAGSVRVTRLFLLGGFAALAPAHAQGFRDLAAGLRAMPHFRDPQFRRQIALMFVPPAHATPPTLAALESWLDEIQPAALADEVEAASQCEDLLPRLAGLKVPVVARVGELDAAAPPAYSEAIVARVANAELQRVPGCGHALLLEEGEATTAAILAALSA